MCYKLPTMSVSILQSRGMTFEHETLTFFHTVELHSLHVTMNASKITESVIYLLCWRKKEFCIHFIILRTNVITSLSNKSLALLVTKPNIFAIEIWDWRQISSNGFK